MKLEVLKSDGTKAGRTVEVADDLFAIEPNEHVMWLTVKQYLANQRQGTHSSKEKSTVSGSTKKMHKQKGTGGARKGSIKAPHFRGGARAFGPHPRDYGFKVNAKEKELARRSALSQKAIEKEIFVVENLDLTSFKTKECHGIMKNLGLHDRKTLLVVNELNPNLKRASKNMPLITLTSSKGLNTYEVMKAKHLLFTEGTITSMNK